MPYTVMTMTTRDNIRDNGTSRPVQKTIKRILFANAKGGCGKSTLATNLASTYASAQINTALIDHDPQGSASQWLKRRPDTFHPIHGIDAFRKDNATTTGNWFMRLPREIERVIVDTPAGLQGMELRDQIQQADVIIVPVLPSPIDIHSATRFIGTILLSAEYRQQRASKHLVVLANRIRKNTRVLHKLDLFLDSLKLPQVGDIRDTQQYVHCYESGIGIIDIADSRHREDRQHWLDLRAWLEMKFGDNSIATGVSNTNRADTCHEIKEGVYTIR